MSVPSGVLALPNVHRTALQYARFGAAEQPEPARLAQSIDSNEKFKGGVSRRAGRGAENPPRRAQPLADALVYSCVRLQYN